MFAPMRKPLALFTILLTGLASTSLMASAIPPPSAATTKALDSIRTGECPVCVIDEGDPLLVPSDEEDPLGIDLPAVATRAGAACRIGANARGERARDRLDAANITPAVEIAPKHDPPPHPADLV